MSEDETPRACDQHPTRYPECRCDDEARGGCRCDDDGSWVAGYVEREDASRTGEPRAVRHPRSPCHLGGC